MAQIVVKNITKDFGHRRVLDQLSWTIEKGSIHALVGENGAGKSTVLKIIYGQVKPTVGTIEINGQNIIQHSPRKAMELGIGMVHQHFMLAGPLNGLQNIAMSAPDRASFPKFLPVGLRLTNLRQVRQELGGILDQFGIETDLEIPVENLSVGEQQRIEIAKLLFQNSKILIFDEPTAVLTPNETHQLFQNLKKLRDNGKTIIIVTHKLREVMELADEVSVIRKGKIDFTAPINQCTPLILARKMVGENLPSELFDPETMISLADRTRENSDQFNSAESVPVLELRNFKLDSQKENSNTSNLSVRSGQILGIAGVERNGQRELVELLINPGRVHHGGTVHFLNKDISHANSSLIRTLPISMIPPDRHEDGLLLSAPLIENFLLGRQEDPQFSYFGLLRGKAIEEQTTTWMQKLDVRPNNPRAIVQELSGGNQQKLIAARELSREPRLMIAVNPTRGVDIGAMHLIHELLRAEKARGTAILLISSDLDELLSLADTVSVLYRHHLGSPKARHTLSLDSLGLAMGGAMP